jgi:glutamyl/glutaminyl-tRNA synthetase
MTRTTNVHLTETWDRRLVQEGVPYCLRIRMDMANDNACLRDPVAYRCNIEHAHLRTGTTHKCYPTYDFACPFVDALEGVTHALRTNEYRDREEQYQRVLKMMQKQDAKLPDVHIWDYSRLNFVHTGALSDASPSLCSMLTRIEPFVWGTAPPNVAPIGVRVAGSANDSNTPSWGESSLPLVVLSPCGHHERRLSP